MPTDDRYGASGPAINAQHRAVERIYRAVADREPAMEVLQLIYGTYGTACNLRPPRDELHLADRCATGGGVARG